MGLLDDAKDIQSQKQFERLKAQNKSTKKINAATYLGKDPIDGSDIVQVDGNEPVDGFRLISNKSISIGDRVSLRPSNGGLQRVDAKNVKPEDEQQPELEEIARTAFIADLNLFLFSGSGFSGSPKSSVGFFLERSNARALTYSYIGSSLKKIPVLSNEILTTNGVATSDNNINPSLCSTVTTSAKDGVNVALSLSTPFIDLPPTQPFAQLVFFNIIFPIKEWKDRFKKLNIQFPTGDDETVYYDWADSPIELDVIGEGLSFGQNAGDRVRFVKVVNGFEGETYWVVGADFAASVIQPFPTGKTGYNFTFRYRRRGAAKWFVV